MPASTQRPEGLPVAQPGEPAPAQPAEPATAQPGEPAPAQPAEPIPSDTEVEPGQPASIASRDPSTGRGGSLVGVLLTLTGVLAGLADYLLVQAARNFCGAGADPDQLTALLFLHLPSRVLLGALLGGGGYVAMRLFLLAFPAIRRSPHSRAVRTGVAGFVGLAAVIVMVLADFAAVGTLADYPGNPSQCGPENIPPWWPTWLPA